MHECWLTNLDQPIAEWFPEYFDAQTDARKLAITIRHLLTMSAGLGWIENTPGIHRWQHSADWARYAIDLPVVAVPGRQFSYNTSLTHLLSIILARASGMNTRQLAERYLFEPAGIELDDWSVDPQGNAIGGTDIFLRPHNLLKIGHLLLNRGTLHKREIVSPAWLSESTQSHITLKQPGFWHPAYKDYGYLWWLRKMQSYDTVVASGYAGQLLFVVRRLGLVVAATADDSIPFSAVMKQSNHIEDLVEDFIIPAVKEDTRHGVIEP
jgi:CubicO group peptidase (beta-lactamase class C family)